LNMRPRPRIVFSISCIIIISINLFWFISGSPPLITESPVRIIIGSLFIFLLPGLIWADILGFRSTHFLETIALSFALTLTIQIILLPIPFLFDSTIKLWIILLFVVSVLGVFILNFTHKRIEFLTPLFSLFKQSPLLNISNLLIIITLMMISYGTYRWGEYFSEMSSEKLFHMMFIRRYYSLPQILNDFGPYPESFPLNLIHLWEYLIAGWSALINMDPLLLIFRARFVIPCLGFSGMYLLIKNIFSNKIVSELIFWGVLIMALGWLVLLSPSGLVFVPARSMRGVTAFMGTFHHADSAMDILIGLSTGLVLLTFRSPGWRNALLLSGVLVSTFMWHSREFFQVALYAGVFGVILFFTSSNFDRKINLKKWAMIMVIFFLVGLFFFGMIVKFSGLRQKWQPEQVKIKSIALRLAILPENLFGIRNLFNFPSKLLIKRSDTPLLEMSKNIQNYLKKTWESPLWLILSALAVPCLILWGGKAEKTLALFYALLWLLALGWNSSMFLILAATYNEMFMSSSRILYIFSYILIADAMYLLTRQVVRKNTSYRNLFLLLFSMLGTGILLRWWWNSGKPYFYTISMVLSLFVIISFILSVFPKTLYSLIPLLSTGLLFYWWWTTSKRHIYVTSVLFSLLGLLSFIVLLSPKISRLTISFISSRFSEKTRYTPLKSSPFVSTVLGISFFFLPVLAENYAKVVPNFFTQYSHPIGWFSVGTPFGFSNQLITYLQSLPPKQTFLVYPFGEALISVYVPQHLVTMPIIGIVGSDREITKEVEYGDHPLYLLDADDDLKPEHIVHEAVKDWLDQYAVNYILVQKRYYTFLLPYFQRFPEDYEIVFNNLEGNEMIVRYLGE
jgi:hypothetical protein